MEISCHMLNTWFLDNGGKDILPMEKPLETNDHKRMMIIWVRTWYIKLINPYTYAAYMNEKNYTTSSGRKSDCYLREITRKVVLVPIRDLE